MRPNSAATSRPPHAARRVEEPRCLVHAPNESVDPSEIEHPALAEALFLSACTR